MTRKTFAKTLILAAFAAAGGLALADDITMDPPATASTRERAAVQAEVLQARADGTLPRAGEFPAVSEPASRSALTRAEVLMQMGSRLPMLIAQLYGAP
ncbi:MAG: DUF4148 domain-containing protein [Rubrivivax sp.]|nr:DUF4148 domain-containing protein [Rubrivivax sp.]